MLRWLVLLTMALLPWFALAHTAVPGPGAAQHEVMRVHTGAADGAPGAPADPDCLEHDQWGTHHEQAAHAGSELGDWPTCPACQACSPAALVATPGAQQPARFEAPRPMTPVRRLASADHAPGFKPPIS